MFDFSVEKALVSSGVVSADEVQELLEKAQEQGVDLPDLLLKNGQMSEVDVVHFYADFHDTDCLDVIDPSLVFPELVRKFSIHYLKRLNAIPLQREDGTIIIAVSHPSALRALNDFRLVLEGGSIQAVFAPAEGVLGAINKVFGDVEEDLEALEVLDGAAVGSFSDFDDDTIEDLLDDTSDAPFIKLVNMVLSQAVRANASDIHIEPYKDILRVRFRLDGVLYDKHSIDKRFHASIVSRIKIMAKLNIAERRLPQDGRIALSLGGRLVDLRVSCLPTALGERIVMRLLEKSTKILSMPDLGLTDENLARMQRLVKISHGIILVTGPTGSGKTTSLYAVLNYINSSDKNILTIEDPVEYQLDGIGQIQVNSKVGLDFASGLRSIVRQDPDVVLIGEIRDKETAQIAIQAALTGHLVFPRCIPTMRRVPLPASLTWVWSHFCCRPCSGPLWLSGWCAGCALSARRPLSPPRPSWRQTSARSPTISAVTRFINLWGATPAWERDTRAAWPFTRSWNCRIPPSPLCSTLPIPIRFACRPRRTAWRV